MSTPPTEDQPAIRPPAAHDATPPPANGAAGALEDTPPAMSIGADVPSESNPPASSIGTDAPAESNPPAASIGADAPAATEVATLEPPPPPPLPPDPSGGASPTPDGADEEEEGMTMLEHLEELRTRVIVMSVALAVGLALSSIPVPGYSALTWNVISVVTLPAQGYLQSLQPGEIFLTYLKVALVVAGALAMPVLIYQMMAFVMPALHPHEKKYLYMAAPGVTLSFVLGILFGYLLLLPFAITFLLNFGVVESGVDVKWSFGAYVGTVTTLLFWMGLAFETPLVMFFLTKLRVLNVDRMVGFRKYALILAFVAGAVITPTPDPLNQTIVSVPLYLLFELGILFSKLA
ncbi:MAG: twin-arginine translocase subunit TatC [Chloroflexi bacterium]|nr:twin-arginine translocase subunit TatC [Chloroflexota bacterium]